MEDPGRPRRVDVAGHELTIFAEAPPLIQAMIDDIRAAATRVWAEVYIFLDDAAGRAVADALKQKARAGLDVRVLYDAIGSGSTPAAFFQEMEEAGVLVHAFHSLWEALWRFRPLRVLNRRDHRKLLVIDDRVAYFGGMNFMDPAGAMAGRQAVQDALPASGGWRDIHVRLVGRQQAELAESFERSWQRARGERVKRRVRAYRQARLAKGEESIQFFDSGPGLRHTRAARVFTGLFRLARRSIKISMAYFIPVGRVASALLRAHRRGVFVRVIVPAESDVPLVRYACRHLYDKLLRRRFHIYERQENMLHSKVVVVDDQWSVLGSCNLDPRSLSINLEFLAVIHSQKLARALNEIIRYEVRHSRRITVRDWAQRRCWERLVDRMAWALRWWL